MDDLKAIKSFEELIEYGSAVLRKELPYVPVTLETDTLVFHNRIVGEGWDQRVDPRIAQYVLTLQDTLDDLLAEHSTEGYKEAQPRVRVKLEEGSSVPWVEIFDFAKTLFTPMTSEQTFYTVMTSLAAIAGLLFTARRLKHKEELHRADKKNEALALHEKTKLEMLECYKIFAENNQQQIQPSERPPRKLVSLMEPEDTIFFTEETGMEKEQARQAAPKRLPRTEEQTTYADGEYVLKSITYTEGEPVLYFSQGDHDAKAYISALSDEDAERLLSDIHTREQTEAMPFSLKLQMNIRHTARRIKYASIVGSGDPRPDKTHKTLAQLVASLK